MSQEPLQWIYWIIMVFLLCQVPEYHFSTTISSSDFLEDFFISLSIPEVRAPCIRGGAAAARRDRAFAKL